MQPGLKQMTAMKNFTCYWKFRWIYSTHEFNRNQSGHQYNAFGAYLLLLYNGERWLAYYCELCSLLIPDFLSDAPRNPTQF